LPDGTNLRLFKYGIKPTWEDPANERGGKWVIRNQFNDGLLTYLDDPHYKGKYSRNMDKDSSKYCRRAI
jgi:hypothetical protein